MAGVLTDRRVLIQAFRLRILSLPPQRRQVVAPRASWRPHFEQQCTFRQAESISRRWQGLHPVSRDAALGKLTYLLTRWIRSLAQAIPSVVSRAGDSGERYRSYRITAERPRARFGHGGGGYEGRHAARDHDFRADVHELVVVEAGKRCPPALSAGTVIRPHSPFGAPLAERPNHR